MMISELKGFPSSGRLFKLFTNLGPYFRKLQSSESSFFFDCLEVCKNAEIEPEEREFYGWWLVVTLNENGFSYERLDGFYNVAGDWVVKNIKKKDKKQLDGSFNRFITRLENLIELETGLKLMELQQVLTEA